MSEEKVFFDIDGKEYCDEDLAISILLRKGVLFSNSRDYMDDGKREGHTIVLFLVEDDVYAWGYAGAQDVSLLEIPSLYKAWEADNKWGAIKWMCKKDNLQPQRPMIEVMKKDGSWDEAMENLKPNKN